MYADVLAETRLRNEEVSIYCCDNIFFIVLTVPACRKLNSLSFSFQRDVHRAIVDKKSEGASASSGAEKPRAGKRGRWDMQRTPDVHAPAAKKSAWDEVSPVERNNSKSGIFIHFLAMLFHPGPNHTL